MESLIVENVKKKFDKIRDIYKQREGFRKNNILPIIGISKKKISKLI